VRFSPTNTAGHPDTPVKKPHLKALTDELKVLHGDLYWLAMQGEDAAAKESPATQLNVELLTALKGAVDDIRLLLWNCIEAASEIDPQRVHEELEAQRVQRMTQFLQLLRNRLGRSSDQEPVSFIERISAAMKDRLGDKVGTI
jgi:hypothetical protein